MSENFEKMLLALRTSVAEIIKAPEADRDELLNKSFSEFEGALSDEVSEIAEGAFLDGHNGDIERYVNDISGSTLSKSASAIAQLATALRVAETSTTAIEVLTAKSNPKIAELCKAWTTMGGEILRSMVVIESGRDQAVADGVLEKNEDPVQTFQTMAKAVKGALAKYERLEKQEGEQVTEEDVAQMDPLEVIGRLAAAILVQIEAINQAGGEAPMDEGEEAAPAEKESSPPSPPAEGNEPAEEEEEKKEAEKMSKPAGKKLRKQDGQQHAPGPVDGGESEGGEMSGDIGAEEGVGMDSEDDKTADKHMAESTSGADGDVEEKEATHEGVHEGSASGAEKARKAGSLKKADPINKVLSAIDALGKRIDRIEQSPAAPKGALRSLEKSDDGKFSDASLQAEAERLSKLKPEDQATALIKMVHQQNPRRVV